jgi:hypothetical protein
MTRTIGRRTPTTQHGLLAEGSHGKQTAGGMTMLGRTYLVQYTDGRGQSQTERGSLVALDQEGFVVLVCGAK